MSQFTEFTHFLVVLKIIALYLAARKTEKEREIRFFFFLQTTPARGPHILYSQPIKSIQTNPVRKRRKFSIGTDKFVIQNLLTFLIGCIYVGTWKICFIFSLLSNWLEKPWLLFLNSIENIDNSKIYLHILIPLMWSSFSQITSSQCWFLFDQFQEYVSIRNVFHVSSVVMVLGSKQISVPLRFSGLNIPLFWIWYQGSG